jgi:hypothetical protein
MSGIGNNPSDIYQRQLDQLNTDFSGIEAELKKLELDNENVVSAYNKAKDVVEKTLEWAKGLGLKDAEGKPLQFKTLQEFHDLCLKGGVYRPDGSAINEGNPFWFVGVKQYLEDLKTAEAEYKRVLGPTLDRLQEAQKKLDTIGVALRETISSLEAMKNLVDTGDIEGAVMLLQTTRAKGLESQLGTEIKAMQARNAQIKLLNEKLNARQEEFSKMDPENKNERNLRADRQKAISDLKTEIDGLNSESQINMIRVQGLVNKRNEAFDMLSNLVGKFQKTIDGIVGNMR